MLLKAYFSPAPDTATRLFSGMPLRMASVGRPFRIRTTTARRGTSSSMIRVTASRTTTSASSGILFALSKGSPNSERT